jgi:hypothetical protein
LWFVQQVLGKKRLPKPITDDVEYYVLHTCDSQQLGARTVENWDLDENIRILHKFFGCYGGVLCHKIIVRSLNHQRYHNSACITYLFSLCWKVGEVRC